LLQNVWRLNPRAHDDLLKLGTLGIALMATVSALCCLTALGLAKRAEWGRRLAIAVFMINAAGDLANATLGHDFRTLIGLPVAALLVAYLMRPAIRSHFGTPPQA
jgi:hypothetical protein